MVFIKCLLTVKVMGTSPRAKENVIKTHLMSQNLQEDYERIYFHPLGRGCQLFQHNFLKGLSFPCCLIFASFVVN